MKQVFRRVVDRQGRVVVKEVPVPSVGEKEILVVTRYSLISSGTEMGTVRKTPLELSLQTLNDPWMRSAVKNTVLSGSVKSTLRTVGEEISKLRVLGYSSAGVVVAKGDYAKGVEINDRVACAGVGYANHAEVVRVPQNLFVKVPENVGLDEAAFARVGAIAMHGLRRANLQFGERVVVVGLGLVGHMAAQVANAVGMNVIGIDVDDMRLELAKKVGIEKLINSTSVDSVARVMELTDGIGADAVIICASSKDKTIANQALKMSRKQGRVIAVGIVPMELERMPFFRNELDFRFSRGHGPGSYDESYEVKGIDYPIGYVRWTENRNMGEFLRLLSEKRIDVKPLIGEVFPIEKASEAYQRIQSGTMKSIAALIRYEGSEAEAASGKTIEVSPRRSKSTGEVNVGIIGCGNFVRSTHLPNIRKMRDCHIRAIASATGVNAKSVAGKYGVDYLTTDYKEILSDPQIDMVLIATRHNLHSVIAVEAARAKKSIFMEKPVAMTYEDCEAVAKAVKENNVHFTVGYNRRFAPLVVSAKSMLGDGTVVINYTVNVGAIPEGHWTLDPEYGGGRIIGESDHFFDLFCYLTGSAPKDIFAQCILRENETIVTQYNFVVLVKFKNGSLATLTYTGKGSKSFPKEVMRIFTGDSVLTLTDFRNLEVVGKKKRHAKSRMNKGHFAEMEEFLEEIRGHNAKAVSLQEALTASACSFATFESLRKDAPIPVIIPQF